MRLAAIAFCLALLICQSPFAAETAVVEHAAVVTSSAPASDVGLSILKQGGNAVDAAVATAFAMAVTFPEAGNIGGGGFMMIWPGGKSAPVCVEYRETAPAAATRDMFQLDETRFGCKMAGVPGTVRGLALAHQRFGQLAWKPLVEPAVRLAADGFVVDQGLASSLNRLLSDKASQPFDELRRIFDPVSGGKWREGDRLIQPELATTLAAIAESGANGFYEGPVADKIAAEMRRAGGLITKDDLASYRSKIRRPVHGTFRGYDIYGPPPPSSGGICLVEMLNVLEPLKLRERGRWSAVTLHLMIEAMRRGYLDRARYLGDADFVKIPQQRLTSKRYGNKLAEEIDLSKATSSESLADDIPLAARGDSTTHFSVIDGNGMAVSNTYTLEYSYGSRVVVPGAGFLLNNEMGDFNRKPGYTDRRGHIGTEANTIAPGKRMLSSQCPTIVARNGKLVMLTGSPGGRTIINTVLNVVINSLEFEMSPHESIVAPRLHHQWLPDVVRFEASDEQRLSGALSDLKERGHTINSRPRKQGDANSIILDRETNRFHAIADPRRGGKAAAY